MARPVTAWLALAAGTLALERATRDQHPLVRMLVLIAFGLMTMKWIVVAQTRTQLTAAQ